MDDRSAKGSKLSQTAALKSRKNLGAQTIILCHKKYDFHLSHNPSDPSWDGSDPRLEKIEYGPIQLVQRAY